VSDIFISYASEDRSRVEPLSKALEEQGWSVWWDRTIPPGKTFDRVIEEAINAARCVIVLWSKKSVKSDWVKEEASMGKQRNILVPAKIDPVDLPLGFGLIQAADLTNWEAEKSHPGFNSLLNAISGVAGPSPKRDKSVERKQLTIAVELGNALAWPADVLALKYAQASYGVDRAVLQGLEKKGIDISERLPKPAGFYLTNSHGVSKTQKVLFIGVERLNQFGYPEIRQFSKNVLTSLAREAPQTKHILLTIHGPNYGLDEIEAFESEIAGLFDAVTSGDMPEELEQITILERNSARAQRLTQALSRIIPDGKLPQSGKSTTRSIGVNATERLRSAGRKSDRKPHIFVAMPFAEEMEDVFHYGIQGAVNESGFLCERADTSSFTGDVMSRVKERIASASLIIADLSGGNPNVYLEVGYAWGCGRPTILLVRDPSELMFDTKGERCLVYKKIKDLEKSLRNELVNLRERS